MCEFLVNIKCIIMCAYRASAKAQSSFAWSTGGLFQRLKDHSLSCRFRYEHSGFLASRPSGLLGTGRRTAGRLQRFEPLLVGRCWVVTTVASTVHCLAAYSSTDSG